MPGVEEVVGVGVFREVRCHRANDAEVINVLGDVWKEIADRDATLAILPELPGRLEHLANIIELRRGHLGFDRLSVFFGQAWLGVKGIHLRRATIHVEEDDMISQRRMMLLSRGLAVKQVCQGESTETISGTKEPIAAGK